jgi:hypothetical protein
VLRINKQKFQTTIFKLLWLCPNNLEVNILIKNKARALDQGLGMYYWVGVCVCQRGFVFVKATIPGTRGSKFYGLVYDLVLIRIRSQVVDIPNGL